MHIKAQGTHTHTHTHTHTSAVSTGATLEFLDPFLGLPFFDLSSQPGTHETCVITRQHVRHGIHACGLAMMSDDVHNRVYTPNSRLFFFSVFSDILQDMFFLSLLSIRTRKTCWYRYSTMSSFPLLLLSVFSVFRHISRCFLLICRNTH